LSKKLTLIACILWLAGLAAFIIGLNISGSTGKWLTLAGEITFLIGLGLEGVLYFRKRNAESQPPAEDKEKPGEP